MVTTDQRNNDGERVLPQINVKTEITNLVTRAASRHGQVDPGILKVADPWLTRIASGRDDLERALNKGEDPNDVMATNIVVDIQTPLVGDHVKAAIRLSVAAGLLPEEVPLIERRNGVTELVSPDEIVEDPRGRKVVVREGENFPVFRGDLGVSGGEVLRQTLLREGWQKGELGVWRRDWIVEDEAGVGVEMEMTVGDDSRQPTPPIERLRIKLTLGALRNAMGLTTKVAEEQIIPTVETATGPIDVKQTITEWVERVANTEGQVDNNLMNALGPLTTSLRSKRATLEGLVGGVAGGTRSDREKVLAQDTTSSSITFADAGYGAVSGIKLVRLAEATGLVTEVNAFGGDANFVVSLKNSGWTEEKTATGRIFRREWSGLPGVGLEIKMDPTDRSPKVPGIRQLRVIFRLEAVANMLGVEMPKDDNEK